MEYSVKPDPDTRTTEPTGRQTEARHIKPGNRIYFADTNTAGRLVTHVEPVADSRDLLVIYAGGGFEDLDADTVVTVLDEPRTEVEQRRHEFIEGLRDLAEFLADNPDIPVGQYPAVDITYFPRGTDAEELAEVQAIAARLGVDTKTNGTHVHAIFEFAGRVRYEAIHIPEQTQRDHTEVMRLGREQLAAQRAAAPLADVDVAAVDTR